MLDLSGFYHEWNMSKLIIKPDKSPLAKLKKRQCLV